MVKFYLFMYFCINIYQLQAFPHKILFIYSFYLCYLSFRKKLYLIIGDVIFYFISLTKNNVLI